MMKTVPMTVAGYQKAKEELKRLKTVERPKIIQEITKAREHGDLSENAEYHAAKEKQSFVEGRLQDLESRLSRAQVIDPIQVKSENIAFGATMSLYNTATAEEVTYQIVGEDEAEPRENKISYLSPMARACIGKSLDDTVRVTLPDGVKEFEVINIEYK